MHFRNQVNRALQTQVDRHLPDYHILTRISHVISFYTWQIASSVGAVSVWKHARIHCSALFRRFRSVTAVDEPPNVPVVQSGNLNITPQAIQGLHSQRYTRMDVLCRNPNPYCAHIDSLHGEYRAFAELRYFARCYQRIVGSSCGHQDRLIQGNNIQVGDMVT